MADNYLAGKSGYVMIGATSYSFGKWRCAMKNGLPKTTNFTTGGARTILAGIYEATITLDGPYNQGNMAFTVGSSYTFLLGFITGAPGVELSITALVESIEPVVDVEDAQRVTIIAQSNGGFTAAIT